MFDGFEKTGDLRKFRDLPVLSYFAWCVVGTTTCLKIDTEKYLRLVDGPEASSATARGDMEAGCLPLRRRGTKK